MPDASAESLVSVVVVTYDALPWIAQSLESVRGHETLVVDNGSTDGTVELVRERFPEVRLIQQENLGLAAGWNAGMRAASGRYYLILNADAWVVGDAVEALVRFADEHPDAAVVGPRLLNPDGTLQRSVRGFPTLWRLATEYFFLRKLAPRSHLLNAFYGGGFDYDTTREVESLYGAALLVPREAAHAGRAFDQDIFTFSAGTAVVLLPGALTARAIGTRSTAATVVFGFGAVFVAWAVVFTVNGDATLALWLLAAIGVVALVAGFRRPLRVPRPRGGALVFT